MATEYDLGNVMGPKGDTGPQGVSISNVSLNEENHIIITLSNQETIDAGEAPAGPQGVAGPAGTSAYQAAIAGGFTGTETEFNQQLANLSKVSSVFGRTGVVWGQKGDYTADLISDSANGSGVVSVYTHTKSGTVHGLTGSGANIKFKATANYDNGDTFNINGSVVTAVNLIPFKTGNWVFAILDGTNLTFLSVSNINSGGCGNTNLLVNPRFKYNSRGQTNYSASTNIFTLDGWMLQAQQNQASISVMDSGIKLNLTNTNQGIRQDFYDYDIPENVQMTSSICIDGVIYSDSFTSSKSGTINLYPNQGFSYALVFSDGLWRFYPIVDYDEESSTYNITAAKLELGSVSTLQAELDNPPPEDVEKLKLDMYSLDPGRCAYLPWHNENLLDNWYFVGGGSQQGGGQFPINQRGQTSYTSNAGTIYGIDRWTIDPGTLTLGQDSISVTGEANSDPIIRQRLENPNAFRGKWLTFSVLAKSATNNTINIYIRYNNYTNIVLGTFNNINDGDLLVVSGVVPDVELTTLMVQASSTIDGANFSVYAAKLELGYLSTLARKDEEGNWVLNDPPPNFQQELAKCQRYCFNPIDPNVSGQKYIFQGIRSGDIYGIMPLPTTMRIRPSVEKFQAGTLRAFGVASSGFKTDIEISALDIYNKMENGVIMRAVGESELLVSGNTYIIYTTTPAETKIILSADL